MSEMICKGINLSKKYKKNIVLDDVNINIKKGDIYGLIGENGAGKTTIMRLITGLAFATSGTIELFGSDDKLNEKRSRTGCIIDSPVIYKEMSAKENLEIIRIQKGIPGKQCIDDVLKLVKLDKTGKKKAGNFSLGMKQRLAIAIALLGEPKFLILDEPINGLDPSGIMEIRELLLKINKERGVTILISSHILTELQQLATCFGFIHKGKIVEEISAKQLNENCRKHIFIKTDEIKKAVVLIENELNCVKFEVHPNNIIKLYDYVDDVKKVATVLSSRNIIIEEISVKGDSLENYFIKLISCDNND